MNTFLIRRFNSHSFLLLLSRICRDRRRTTRAIFDSVKAEISASHIKSVTPGPIMTTSTFRSHRDVTKEPRFSKVLDVTQCKAHVSSRSRVACGSSRKKHKVHEATPLHVQRVSGFSQHLWRSNGTCSGISVCRADRRSA